MAEAKITLRQNNGTSVSVEGVIPDDYAVEVTTMLAAMLFEASANPAPVNSDNEPPAVDTSPVPED